MAGDGDGEVRKKVREMEDMARKPSVEGRSSFIKLDNCFDNIEMIMVIQSMQIFFLDILQSIFYTIVIRS